MGEANLQAARKQFYAELSDLSESHAEERKSTSGWAYFVFFNLVSWRSKLQPITAGSTHEAELIALSFCSDEGLWIRKLLAEAKFAPGLRQDPSSLSFIFSIVKHTEMSLD